MEEKLLKVAGQPLRHAFLLGHDSGMRPDEIIRLRWEDIFWERNLIFVQEGKTRKATRYVPLNDPRFVACARTGCGIRVGVPVVP